MSIDRSIGLARSADFFTRPHGHTKATRLGVGAMVPASLLHFTAQRNDLSLKEPTVALFPIIAAPVGAHLLSKAAPAERRRKAASHTTPGDASKRE